MAQKILWKMHSIDMVELCGSVDHDGFTGYDLYLNALNDLKSLMLNAAHSFTKMFVENLIRDGAGNLLQGEEQDSSKEKGDSLKKMPSQESNTSTVNTSVDRSISTGGNSFLKYNNF